MKCITQIITIAALAYASIGLAGTPSTAARQWRNRVADSSDLLKSGEYAKALKIADRLIDDMVERLGGGGAEDEVFAIVLAHKALANSGLGKPEDALWYWYIALDLYPSIGKADMSMFGTPGQFLKQHSRLPAPAGVRPDDNGVTPPRILKRVDPKFPPGAYVFGISGELIVEFVIDERGIPTQPRILKALPAPTLSYVALEALRHWRFDPGKINGAPTPVIFNLTVRYKL